ncbi:unnamed protein product [Bursaphelenchus xylophilus]|uniref:Cation-transporting ATPase n=1 Tax=Bursaphelenchus xylophilus TaxID=6326 RepID=A0A1I7S407_BURXY|nr:unnamed protein product [Bursaphelenchus xylophilus]CAG9116608.1 unnamed protein product [Bursaphelenchus xylophilus]
MQGEGESNIFGSIFPTRRWSGDAEREQLISQASPTFDQPTTSRQDNYGSLENPRRRTLRASDPEMANMVVRKNKESPKIRTALSAGHLENLETTSDSSSEDSFEFHGASDAANAHYAVIHLNDEDLHIWAYKLCLWKAILMYLFSFATLGIVRLVLYWYPKLYVHCTSNKSTMAESDYMLVRDDHQNLAFRKIRIAKPPSNDFLSMPVGKGKMVSVSSLRYFTYRKLCYVWHPTESRFSTTDQLENDLPLGYFHDCWDGQKGLTEAEVQRRLTVYGKNLIEVKLKPIIVLLFKEVISPFYIFQVFSVLVWYSDDYEYYASIIVLMSVCSIVMDIFQIRRQEKKLRAMVHSEDVVEVVRDGGKVKKVSSSSLVPGDVILIPPRGCILQCDAVLMNGTVILNESMLTGESVPVTKVALPEPEDDKHREYEFSLKEHSKHILFCGTSVLQTRFYGGKPVQAIVLRTAYLTLKGQLVRSIMYPKPVDFRFTKDLFRFVGFLSMIAMVGFGYTIAVMIMRGSALKKIILRSLDIITIVVPPALPAAMSIGIFAAQMRLRAKQIFCISPSTINTCGAINVVCFDKTGTLTEDGLDFHCLRAVYEEPRQLQAVREEAHEPVFGEELYEFHRDELPHDGELVKAVATCHSLTRIENELCGDPLDLILFNKTNWIIDESPTDDQIEETALFDMLQPTVIRSPAGHFGSNEPETEMAVIRQFTFSSSLQRMGVIVHNPNEPGRSMHLYVKGAPEIVASLCRPESVPSSYDNVVNHYAQHGYRLIAVASRKLDLSYAKAQKVKRDVIECDLRMLGVIVMENRVKTQTCPVIGQLNKARIRTVMVTGDNVLTAMSVARECGIIRPYKRTFLLEHGGVMGDGRVHLSLRQSASASDELNEFEESSTTVDPECGHLVDSSYQLAITGPTFAAICDDYPELLDKLICVCDVYARMSPDQKQLLINTLQEVNYTVAMCGDGANDCAALKAAHAGISLSEAEASIAAPFTSKIPDIRCVPMVIREGRAALVTSFGVFKYMAGYSLTQFITIMQLYWLNTNLTDFQFLYIDLGLITLVALFFGYTPSCEKLDSTPPPTRLLSLASALSIIGQLFIIAGFQLFVFIYTAMQPWFIPYAMPMGDDVEDRRSMQGTAIFCVSTFQYITLAIIYSKGHPYRKPLFSNRPLCFSLIILSLISAWITVNPPDFLSSWLEFDPIPYFENRLFLLMIAILSGLCSYLFENYVIEHVILGVRERRKKRQQIVADSSDAPRFERILNSIGSEPQWIRNLTTAGLRSEPSLFTPTHNKFRRIEALNSTQEDRQSLNSGLVVLRSPNNDSFASGHPDLNSPSTDRSSAVLLPSNSQLNV